MNQLIKVVHKGLDRLSINNLGKFQVRLFLSFTFPKFSLKLFLVTYIESINVYMFYFGYGMKSD